MASADKPSTIAPTSRFLARDHELLKSERFADVEVKCGTRTWKLHRLILSSRCAWFDKALSGKFKEAVTGCVVISDFEPLDIEHLINYIYTGSMSVDNHLRANCFADPVTLYELGDYFMVPELCEDALQLLTTKFNKAVGIIQKHHLGQPQSSKKQTTGQRIMDLSDIKPSKLYESFSEVVGMIYAHGALSSKKTLRDLLVSFFTRTQLFLIRKDSSAFHFLSETPQFAADILSSHGTFGLGMTEINIPKHCFKCQKNIVDGPEDIRFDKLCFTHKQSHGHDYYGHNNSTMLFVSAYCQHCARATENRLSRSSVAPAADIVLLSEFEL